jgi:hypothetical protein
MYECTLLSRRQNAGKNHNISIANRYFENVTEIKYLGMTVTNQNLIQEDIKSRLKSDNALCYSYLNPLTSCPLCKTYIYIHTYYSNFSC